MQMIEWLIFCTLRLEFVFNALCLLSHLLEMGWSTLRPRGGGNASLTGGREEMNVVHPHTPFIYFIFCFSFFIIFHFNLLIIQAIEQKEIYRPLSAFLSLHMNVLHYSFIAKLDGTKAIWGYNQKLWWKATVLYFECMSVNIVKTLLVLVLKS